MARSPRASPHISGARRQFSCRNRKADVLRVVSSGWLSASGLSFLCLFAFSVAILPSACPRTNEASPMQTRRSFLLSAGATAVAVAGSSATAFAANETLNVGLIGTGGRCRHLLKSLITIPNVKVTAIADVWDAALAETRKMLKDEVFVTKSYPELLARKDVDAVLIASPDHWHVPMTVDACAAGKDVYVEKPLTHELSEGKAVIDAQNKHKRIVQVGTQQRSMPHIAQAREMVQSGRIGKVVKVHMTWNRNTDRVRRFKGTVDPKTVDWKAFLGNAKEQPFDDYRM